MRFTATLLFFITLLVGLAVAPDKLAALDRLALLTAGLFAAWALVWLSNTGYREIVLGLTAMASAWLAGLLGGYYLLTNDWSASGEEKFALIGRVGQWIQALRPTLAAPETINSNVMAGALVVLIPLGVGAVVWLWRRRRMTRWLLVLAVLTALPVAVALVALGLSASRGGWLALGTAAVCGVFWYYRWRLADRPLARTIGDAVVWSLLGGLVALWAAVLVLPDFAGPLGSAAAGGSAVSRAALWRDALAVVDDYRFTGAGLGSTMMVLSTYVFILHVGFLTHVHNLFMQIAVEQGLPGMIAFGFLVGTAAWSLRKGFHSGAAPRSLIAGGAAALVALCVHGLVDAGLYVSRLAPLVALPIGFAWATAPRRRREPSRPGRLERTARGAADRPGPGGCGRAGAFPLSRRAQRLPGQPGRCRPDPGRTLHLHVAGVADPGCPAPQPRRGPGRGHRPLRRRPGPRPPQCHRSPPFGANRPVARRLRGGAGAPGGRLPGGAGAARHAPAVG